MGTPAVAARHRTSDGTSDVKAHIASSFCHVYCFSKQQYQAKTRSCSGFRNAWKPSQSVSRSSIQSPKQLKHSTSPYSLPFVLVCFPNSPLWADRIGYHHTFTQKTRRQPSKYLQKKPNTCKKNRILKRKTELRACLLLLLLLFFFFKPFFIALGQAKAPVCSHICPCFPFSRDARSAQCRGSCP
jgi:hypothetical protein